MGDWSNSDAHAHSCFDLENEKKLLKEKKTETGTCPSEVHCTIVGRGREVLK